jgi:hypothetical protein
MLKPDASVDQIVPHSAVSHHDYQDLVAVAKRYGVTLKEDWNEPAGARFIGTFSGHDITLFPRNDSYLTLYFTVAHLYGHMVQLARPTPRNSVDLNAKPGEQLTEAHVQQVFDHEYEAAEIGRKLMAETGPISATLDAEYARMFWADFHYLINFLETGEKGPEIFARYLRRQPITQALIAADSRPLVDLANFTPPKVDVIVV